MNVNLLDLSARVESLCLGNHELVYASTDFLRQVASILRDAHAQDVAFASLRERIDALETTLRFYGEAKNWQTPSSDFAAQYDPEPSPTDRDRGAQARAAVRALLEAPHAE